MIIRDCIPLRPLFAKTTQTIARHMSSEEGQHLLTQRSTLAQCRASIQDLASLLPRLRFSSIEFSSPLVVPPPATVGGSGVSSLLWRKLASDLHPPPCGYGAPAAPAAAGPRARPPLSRRSVYDLPDIFHTHPIATCPQQHNKHLPPPAASATSDPNSAPLPISAAVLLPSIVSAPPPDPSASLPVISTVSVSAASQTLPCRGVQAAVSALTSLGAISRVS